MKRDSKIAAPMEEILFTFISQYMVLTEEEKNAIRDLNVFRSYQKGTIILKEGDLSDEGYFVLKGCLRTYYLIDGEEKTTAFYTESEVLTPVTSVNNTPSEYFISCIEDTIILVSTSSTVNSAFERFPRFETLCRILSEKLLAKNMNSFDDFKNSTPEQRYRNLLEKRPDLIQRIPLHYLASYLGITPESLSRIRKRLLKT